MIEPFNLTSVILQTSFEVMNELGSGFLESVYKNALCYALKQKGFSIAVEQRFDVYFRQQKVGVYIADLVVENALIVELKCCRNLLPEHQAQVINYLSATSLQVGLLINFGNKKLEYKRLVNPNLYQTNLS